MKRAAMFRAFALTITILLCACSSAPKETGMIAPTCAKTPVQAKDLEQFGFKAQPGKIGVMRIFATWCPYCKEDLSEIGGHFRNGDYKAETVQVYLLAFKNSKESKGGFDQFVRKTFPLYGIPITSAQIVYVNKDFNALSQAKAASGAPLFTGWQGMPFGLIFGKDGRLAFRGHFTTSPQLQDNHYLFIKDLTKEACAP
jgi:hypothetical protein